METAVNIDDLAAVTETRYPFGTNPISIKSDELKLFWKLMTGSNAVDCYTGELIKETHQEIVRNVAVACEHEMELHAAYMTYADWLAHVDEQRQMGNLLRDVSSKEIVAQCMIEFDKWKLATTRVRQLESNLKACREDRIRGLKEVLLMKTKIQSIDTENWIPKDDFFEAVANEIHEMSQSVPMTEYYRMQRVWAHETGRPFFNSREMTCDGQLSFENDPFNSHPIRGTLTERFAAMATAL